MFYLGLFLMYRKRISMRKLELLKEIQSFFWMPAFCISGSKVQSQYPKVQWVKLPPATPTCHTGTGSSSSCFISDLVPCSCVWESNDRWSSYLDPCLSHGRGWTEFQVHDFSQSQPSLLWLSGEWTRTCKKINLSFPLIFSLSVYLCLSNKFFSLKI